ncbi:MAG: VOC family protein [Bacteroidetes bacterium]|nr:VOC family protein [Bacteroidota bacterium]
MENLQKCRINVMVSNMDSAVEFYSEKLGLELINRYGDDYAEIQAPGLMIGLHPNTENTTVGNNISIGFGVINFDKTIENLQAKGIEFTIEEEEWVRLALFTDLDNNALFLAENKN